MRRLWLFCLCLALPPLHAQAATLSGFVTDKANGEFLSYTNIILKDTGLGAVSNASGYYAVNNIPAGTYTVPFSYIGY